MIKKTLTYKDFTGEEQTEEFYFHLTEADVLELEVSASGNSLAGWIEKIVKAQNGEEIIATFKKIISVSYGVKSADGRRFIKSPESLAEFKSTNAYSKLFVQLASDDVMGAEFVNGIMPEEMVAAKAANASEAARKASEARLQGYQKSQPKQVSTVERQPDLPVELQTAPPVLSPEPALNQEEREGEGVPPVTTEVAQPDVNAMSIDELREYALRRGTQ